MRGRAAISLDLLFSPITIAVVLYVPLFLVFLAMSPATFVTEFNAQKATDTAGISYLVLSLLLFAFGAVAGLRFVGRPVRRESFSIAAREPRFTERTLDVVKVALLVSIAAYLAWFASGVARAGGISALVNDWLTNPENVKENVLATTPGVTTLTQLSVAAIPLAVAYGLLRRRSVKPLIVTVFALAFVRSFIFSERLALLELVVPVLYLATSRRKVVLPKAVLVVVAAGFTVLTLFAITEARRSYVYTQNFSLTHVTARFFGYYVTSENNAVVVAARYPGATPFANTGAMFWSFPVVDKFSLDTGVGRLSLRYEDIFGKSPTEFWSGAFADSGLSPEYNVFTTPGFLAADFGWFGLVGVALIGFVSAVLWRRARTTEFHRAFYAVWLVGLLEFMRIMYFFDTRALPVYLVFAILYLVLARRSRELEWELSRHRTSTGPAGAAAPAGSGTVRADRPSSLAG